MKLSLRNWKKTQVVMAGILLAIAAGLWGCSTKSNQVATQATLIQSLEQQGAMVTTVGETVTILLPSDALFVENSANFQAKYKPVLKQVAQLLRSYILVSVQVRAYSDNIEALDLQALTTKQAQRVANALWNQGIDARLIYAEGGGATNMVVKGGSLSQRAPNRRVEIKFRYYLPVSYYD